MLILLIFGILAFLYFFVIKPYTVRFDNLTLTTGTPGSGKSFFSVMWAITVYKSQVFKVRIYNLFHPRKKKPIPRFYSNIGVRISRKEYSYKLTWQHLMLQKKIVEGSVVFIDEVSLFLPQYDIENVNRDTLVEFFTLFRHYFGGYIFMNTQNLKKVNAIIRYCVSTVLHLSQFRKFFSICPIMYSCKVRNLSVVEDTLNVVNENVEDSMRNLIGFFPLYKHYDSRTYSKRYDTVPSQVDVKYTSLKTKKLFRVPSVKVSPKTSDKE